MLAIAVDTSGFITRFVCMFYTPDESCDLSPIPIVDH